MALLFVIFIVGLFLYNRYNHIEPFQQGELYTVLGFRSLEADSELKKNLPPFASSGFIKFLDAKTQQVLFDEKTNNLTDSSNPTPKDFYFKDTIRANAGYDKPKPLEEIKRKFPIRPPMVSVILKNESTGKLVFDPDTFAPPAPAPPEPAPPALPAPALPAPAPSPADSLTLAEVNSLRGLIQRFPPPKPAPAPARAPAPQPSIPGR